MRKNMIMLCSALSFAMAATDDACAMVSKVVYGIGIETAKASTLGLIIDLETAAEGKLAGDMITIRVRTEGGGERPSVECPVLALKRFVLLLKEEKIIVEEPSGAYYSLLGSFLPSVILSAFLFPCKISIPETCVSELWDMQDVSSCIPRRIKIEEEKLQDGTTNFFLSLRPLPPLAVLVKAIEDKHVEDMMRISEGKRAGDMMRISFPTEGRGDGPIVECPVLAIKRFVSILKEAEEDGLRGAASFLGLLIPSAIRSATFCSCKIGSIPKSSKISIPKTCKLELKDMRAAMSFCTLSGVKIEEEEVRDGWIDFFISPGPKK